MDGENLARSGIRSQDRPLLSELRLVHFGQISEDNVARTACFHIYLCIYLCTAELQLSGLIGTARHPTMQKVRIIGFFFENILHLLFDVRLLLFTVCICVHGDRGSTVVKVLCYKS